MFVDDLHFEGDPAIDSTRRRLERILKDEPRPGWGWIAALAAGSTMLLFWQLRKRRRDRNNANENRSNGRGTTS
jgi:hypothetical protein